nr:mercuric reductase [uncultured Dethiosulfovibrio sp.]
MEKMTYPDSVRPFCLRGCKEGNDRYDLVVIGAGSAGLVAAVGGARMGAKVALIEKGLLGGDCLNSGCVPSKAIIASARRAHLLKTAKDMGISSGEIVVDFPAVMSRMKGIRSRLSANDSALRLLSEGVDIFPGNGVFDSPRSIKVGEKTIEFTRAIIATGSSPVLPSIPGLDGVEYLTNKNLFDLEELPESMAVVGGGPLGCEMAQAFARLGCSVTLLQRANRLLPKEDAQAAGLVRKSLESDGVKVLLGVQVTSVRVDGDETVLTYRDDDVDGDVSVKKVLLAAGRKPNLEGMGLEEANIAYDESGLKVEKGLRSVSNERVFGAGDACLSQRFTHSADMSARICLANAFLPFHKSFNSVPMAWCTYTSPEVARVGITVDQALEQGLKAKEIRVPLEEVDRAVLEGWDNGFLKVVIGRGGKILGATMVGEGAGNMISELTLAVSKGIKLGDLSWVVHPYPTESSVFRRAADILNSRRITPVVRIGMQLWMALVSKFKDKAQKEEDRAAKEAAKAERDAAKEALEEKHEPEALPEGNEKVDILKK